jgi:MoxR-like ATPase
MLKVVVGYPQKDEEMKIIRQNISDTFDKQPSPVVKPESIIRAREVVREVYMVDKIERYIVDIVFATRTPSEYKLAGLESLISYGASPRASINLALASKAYAFVKRRGYVIPEDVRAVCYDVLRHRIGLTYEAEAENVTGVEIITRILNAVEVP